MSVEHLLLNAISTLQQVPAELFWQALERVGALALLAAVLYGGWKIASSWFERENMRLDNLIAGMDERSTSREELLGALTNALDKRDAEWRKVVESLRRWTAASEQRGSEVTDGVLKIANEAVAMMAEVTTLLRALQESSTEQADTIRQRLDELRECMEELNARVDGQMRSKL